MLGDSLLVAPVFNRQGIVDYYVPHGKWTNLLRGTVIEGPRWVRETHDAVSLPLLVRPNSVIPTGSHSSRPDYDYSDEVTLQVYQLEEGKQVSVEIPGLDGKIETTFNFRRAGDEIHVERQGSSKAWNVLLVGIFSVEKIENVQAGIVNGSTYLRASKFVSELKIKLRDEKPLPANP
jgi:alpha-D-xyloside xylohydrolase